MDKKRFIVASIVVFVITQAVDWLVHGLALADRYRALQHLWRPDMNDLLWLMGLASLFFSFMFVFIFTKAYEGKGLLEGARYGCYIGLLVNVPGMLGQYAMYPIPPDLAAIWFAYGVVEMILAGIATALIYQKL